ncbi:Pre-mRNA-splicing factor ATP-dependent RNA helicase [Heracleum sosnowskyi]|uniref:Pre-mRNA-splicing factor ATP-dependent RNA helicase n=1 Tax=Heracleum sosnowskyi TaxID=360622 RepID=A0AAD8J329_9APIA|nr:Pre-mRNA-splicing factor ATP-dependent RNA helicase [Heracleum sosnowskyi]
MATNITRLLGNNRPLGLGTSYVLNSKNRATGSSSFSVVSKMGFQGEKNVVAGGGEKKPTMAVKASVALVDRTSTSKTQTSDVVHLSFILANVSALVLHGLKMITQPRPWRLHIQMLIERVVIDTRFFAMLAVGGSLLGSVLCFLEGSFIIIESYLQYLQALSHGSASEHGHHIVHLLIEAMDMYLVGTAVLIFGTGLHVMFVGTQNLEGKGTTLLPRSNFFGLFPLQKLPTWAGMNSIGEAKTKIGHALMMILQVGVMEKFKSIPLVTGLDLACFAGALFISSASIFLLARLTSSAIGSAAAASNQHADYERSTAIGRNGHENFHKVEKHNFPWLTKGHYGKDICLTGCAMNHCLHVKNLTARVIVKGVAAKRTKTVSSG